MKKLLTVASLIMSAIFFANLNCYAQNQFKLGAGLAYGTKVEAIGIQVGGVYRITDKISGSADVVYYFPDQPKNVDVSLFGINLNGQYDLYREDNIRAYGLAGLNFAIAKVAVGNKSVSDSNVGLNIGGGAEFGTGPGDIYAELKYALSSYDQLVISAGYRYRF